MSGNVTTEQVAVRVAVAPLLGEPRIAAEQLTQILRGWPCTVLEERGDWLRVRADADGYEGWLNRGYTRQRIESPHSTSLGCVVMADAGAVPLPFGARLFASDTLASGDSVHASQLPRQFPPNANAIAATALEYFRGAPYQWGGVTPWGADCSGFVQSIFRMHGIRIARDSGQQALAGSDLSSDILTSVPGQLIFFSERADQRITHVGMALGDARMAHVALGRGGYAVEDFRDETDPYLKVLRERFRFMRQIV